MIREKIKLYKTKKKWRALNHHNNTTISFPLDAEKVHVGIATYGELIVYNNGTESKLVIGNYCSIGSNVTFLVGADHYLNHISTYPYKAMILRNGSEATSKGDIIVDDDVWIGNGATILSRVHIGQGAVIAAGAVVVSDIPPYAIAGGVPAKIIKYRFEPEMIKELLRIDYSKLTKEDIENHIDDLYAELKDKGQLKWMQTK